MRVISLIDWVQLFIHVSVIHFFKPHLLSLPGLRIRAVTSRIRHAMLILGITRSILRCSDAVASPSCTDGPIIISRMGGDQILHDDIPLFLHCIPTVRIRYR